MVVVVVGGGGGEKLFIQDSSAVLIVTDPRDHDRKKILLLPALMSRSHYSDFRQNDFANVVKRRAMTLTVIDYFFTACHLYDVIKTSTICS